MNGSHHDRLVLVIDDEDSICLAMKRFFESRGWGVTAAATAEAGLAAHGAFRPDVVFLDVRLPDRSGLSLLNDLTAQETSVVVMTAYGGFDTVIRAIHGKAYDYLVKPVDLDQAFALAERIWESRHREHAEADHAPDASGETLVGRSPAMQEVFKLIARATAAAAPVLVDGETGTGKELAARAIHRLSDRADRPFVPVNCGAIPDHLIESELFGHVRGAFTGAEKDRTGRFELADGGCLLLDEIGDLPYDIQVKLLRVLDDGVIERVGEARTRRLDVRVIAVTNRNLEEEVRLGRFRQDLFYRLNVLRLTLPPLRQRAEDIELLAEHFLTRDVPTGADACRIGRDARQTLRTHPWPGNVRELKNAIAHAMTVAPGGTIRAEDLPPNVRYGRTNSGADREAFDHAVVDYAVAQPGDANGRCQATIERVERALIAYAMKRYGGNQSMAAAFLGIHRNTLRTKLSDLKIDIHARPDPVPKDSNRGVQPRRR